MVFFPRSDCEQPYRAWFRCPVEFAAVDDGVLFRREDVRRPLAAANAEVARAIGRVMAHEFARLHAEGISGQTTGEFIDYDDPEQWTRSLRLILKLADVQTYANLVRWFGVGEADIDYVFPTVANFS